MPLDLDRTDLNASRSSVAVTAPEDVQTFNAGPMTSVPAGRTISPTDRAESRGGLAAMRRSIGGARDRAAAFLVEHTGPRLSRLAVAAGEAWSRVRPRLGLKSLYWRILIVNLSGLALMLVAILFLGSQQDWLIEAKRESIQAQAQVIGDAIVREAIADERGFSFPDPDRYLDGDRSHAVDTKPYELQDFAFAIQPERVAPILQRYSQSSGLRARIYARDGTMIYDSAGLSHRVTRRDLPPIGRSDEPTVQSLWTRLDSMFMPSNLPVYREIGHGNGRAYAEVAAALEGQSMPMMMVNDRGSHIVSVAVPIQRMKSVQGALLLSTREGEIDGIRRKERHLYTWIFIVAAIVTALTALALAGTIARPMRRLSEAAMAVKRNISAAKDLPTFPDQKDEIGQMASAFRDMTLALYKRIELSEKFAADVAHELKNPVTAVRSATESLSYVRDEKDRDELIQTIQVDLKRLNKLITDISNFSRLDAELSLNEAELVDVAVLVDGVATAFNDMKGTASHPRPVVTHCEPGGDGRPARYLVSGHESRLGQVLTNLVDNALSFSPPQGRVQVRVNRVDQEIVLIVEDEGPGIPDDRLDKVFDRFYTDRPDSEATQGKNSGLGLSISREIVTAHAGRIWAENRGGAAGARFCVVLPAASSAGGTDMPNRSGAAWKIKGRAPAARVRA